MIQVYCPQSENWRSSSSDVFTRVDRGLYKLTKPTDTARLSSLEGQVITDLESISQENSAIEGGKKERLSAYFERNPKLRAKAILLHGTSCETCGFNFEEKYGEHGKDYIEVHHLVPISTLSDPKNISPKDDRSSWQVDRDIVIIRNIAISLHKHKMPIDSLLREPVQTLLKSKFPE